MHVHRFLALAVSLMLVGNILGRHPIADAAPSPALRWSDITVQGQTQTWKLTLLSIRKMLTIPHTSWSSYRSTLWTMWVLTLRMTNMGTRPADIYDDLDLALKTMPQYQTYPTPGWTSLRHESPYTAIYQGAARDFGGALPWQATQPKQTTVYCYVIAAKRGESHYGLYNIFPTTGTTFLLDTGY